ncbi:MAG: precorrin-2 C(20)-methyltransferase [Hespellia sp.]|nr:precorrin-2 C(20)-methyltransferase [Hespellia sp.]
MDGKLTGVGVGPGDPELLTLKAVRIIKECDVAAVPVKEVSESVAYQIARGAVPELENKEVLAIDMPMTKDKEVLHASHMAGADQLEAMIKNGKKIAFLTLGDPTVYSTYLYLHKEIKRRGYETEIISGIPSFCAVAAKLNEGLVERAEQLHVIPASYHLEEALSLPGTKVLMKAGKKIAKVKQAVLAHDEDVMMIENCGMENEKIYTGAEEIPDSAGYYSLIIVKDKISEK